MFKSFSKFPELRILTILGIITLSYHLLTIFGSFLSFFADLFLIIFLAWILAFIIEPLVFFLEKKQFNKTISAVIVYISLAILAVVIFLVVIPTTVSQLSQLSSILPNIIPSNSLLTSRFEDFITSTLNNSVSLVSQLASAVTSLLLIFILSFYFLLSRQEISRLILRLIPDDYEEDYKFLEHTLNTTFATFLRVQVILGLTTGIISFIILLILRVDYALSTSIATALLATIPVVGPILGLIPPTISSFLISPQKFLIVLTVLTLTSQIIYNIWAPRLLGNALKIHPILVLLSFVVGYKIAGIWGAVFSVPVTSSLAIIGKDLLKYWQQEADK